MDKPQLLRRLFHFAWPVLIVQLSVMAGGVIDTLMAGRLSAEDLAGVGIGASIYVSVFITLTGVLLALLPTVAQLHGAGRYGEIGEEVRQAAWLALALAGVGVFLLRNPDPLIALARLTPPVEARVRGYLDATAWGVPAALAFRVFYGFMAGSGRPRAVMGINLVGLALKVPLNVAFIHGYAGLPAMGGPGCAAASSVIAWITAVLAWGWCARRVDCEGYAVFGRWSGPQLPRIGTLLKLGLPISGTYLADVTAFTFMALFIARLGPVVSAAHQIAANLGVLAFMLPLALGNAAAVLCGQSLGAGDAAQARRAGLLGLAAGVAFGCVVAAGLFFGAGLLAAIYTPDAAVRAAAAPLIAIAAAYHLFDSLQAVAVNVLRGYKKTAVPMVVYAVALWGVGLGGGYVLGLTDWLGPARGAAGFWWAATASLALAGSAVTLFFLRVSRQFAVQRNARVPQATKP
jgi:multidrug resistance protein, MATE family